MNRREEFAECKDLIQECLREFRGASQEISDFLDQENDQNISHFDGKSQSIEAERRRLQKEAAKMKITQKFQSLRNNFASSLLDEDEEDDSDDGDSNVTPDSSVNSVVDRVTSSFTEQDFRSLLWKQFMRLSF
jgi:hypothetical protein